MPKQILGIALVALLGVQNVLAQSVETKAEELAEDKTRSSHSEWGLSKEQWRKYEALMSGNRGVWSPGIDPITALGVSTDSVIERRRLAELYVRTEFERTRKELAFQVAVDDAWRRLYPQTQRLGQRSGGGAVSAAAERYAVVVTPDCGECDKLINDRLSALLDEATAGVDFHIVGTSNNDQVLRAWAAEHISVLRAVESGRATINHGESFADLTRFPAIYRKNGEGKWSREL